MSLCVRIADRTDSRKARKSAGLEANLFRYPHGRVTGDDGDIHVVAVDRAADEAEYIAGRIRELVRDKGYRYKDIAVVAGDLQDVARYYRQAMEERPYPCVHRCKYIS